MRLVSHISDGAKAAPDSSLHTATVEITCSKRKQGNAFLFSEPEGSGMQSGMLKECKWEFKME